MQSTPLPRSRPLKRDWRFWLGILLSVASVAWLFFTTNWPATWAALKSADYGLVAAAMALNLSTIPLRSARWRLTFLPQKLPAFGRLTAIMLIGQAVNVIAPARLGDLLRASLVKEESVSYVLGTQVLQSALDLLMVAALTTLLLFQLSLPAWWKGSAQALLLTSGVIFAGVIGLIVARQPVLRFLTHLSARWPWQYGHRAVEFVAQFLHSLNSFRNPFVLGVSLLASVLIWGIYGAVNYLLLAAVGVQPSLLAAFFLLVVLQLSIAVPSSPGRIGVYHYLSVLALAVFGVNNAQALSFAIILHLISIIMPIVLGAILAWLMNVNLDSSAWQTDG